MSVAQLRAKYEGGAVRPGPPRPAASRSATGLGVGKKTPSTSTTARSASAPKLVRTPPPKLPAPPPTPPAPLSPYNARAAHLHAQLVAAFARAASAPSPAAQHTAALQRASAHLLSCAADARAEAVRLRDLAARQPPREAGPAKRARLVAMRREEVLLSQAGEVRNALEAVRAGGEVGGRGEEEEEGEEGEEERRANMRAFFAIVDTRVAVPARYRRRRPEKVEDGGRRRGGEEKGSAQVQVQVPSSPTVVVEDDAVSAETAIGEPAIQSGEEDTQADGTTPEERIPISKQDARPTLDDTIKREYIIKSPTPTPALVENIVERPLKLPHSPSENNTPPPSPPTSHLTPPSSPPLILPPSPPLKSIPTQGSITIYTPRPAHIRTRTQILSTLDNSLDSISIPAYALDLLSSFDAASASDTSSLLLSPTLSATPLLPASPTFSASPPRPPPSQPRPPRTKAVSATPSRRPGALDLALCGTAGKPSIDSTASEAFSLLSRPSGDLANGIPPELGGRAGGRLKALRYRRSTVSHGSDGEKRVRKRLSAIWRRDGPEDGGKDGVAESGGEEEGRVMGRLKRIGKVVRL